MEGHVSVPPVEEQGLASEANSELPSASESDTVAQVDPLINPIDESVEQASKIREAKIIEEETNNLLASDEQVLETSEPIRVDDDAASDVRDTEIAAQASTSTLPDNGPTELQRLRDLVFASRGTKASLPIGWDDNKEEVRPEAVVQKQTLASKGGADADGVAQKMLQRAIDLVGQLASDNDSDSDSDSDSASESDASTPTSSHTSAIQQKSMKKKPAKVVIQETLSDDEEEGGKVGTMGPVTKNEVLEPTVDAPPYSIVPDHQEIRPLGKIHSIVDCVVVVAQDVGMAPGTRQQAKDAIPARAAPLDRYGRKGEEEGEYSVLDTGSLLAFQDRNVLGVVFETFGSVLSPLYALRYTTAAHVNKDMIQIGKPVFYVPSNSTYVLTRSLRALGKGSDASNLWDEEIDDDEREFSDDEAEAAYKRNAKVGKGKGKKRSNGEEQHQIRPKHHLPMRPMSTPSVHRDASINQQSQALSYDDEETLVSHRSYQQPTQSHYPQPIPPQSAYAEWLYQQQQQRQQYPLTNGVQSHFQPYQAPGPGSSTAVPFPSSESYDPLQPHFAFPPSQPPPRW